MNQPTDNALPVSNGRARRARFMQKVVWYLANYWFPLFLAVPLFFLLLGVLAPALLAEGKTEAATAVYRFLAIDNHQMPDRSYFLFGQANGIQTYPPETLIAAGADPQDWEAFTGNEALGYKTGLNHRMIAVFLGMVVGGLAWGLSRGRLGIGFIIFVLLTLPILADGFSHIISETEGTGARTTNEWAVAITGGAFPEQFYQGDTAGSLNWWLRTVTGFLFGLGIVLFLFARFDNYFRQVRRRLGPRLFPDKVKG